MQKIFIITALPFRKQGNQSMMRFVKMFLNKQISVVLLSAGKDTRGQHALEHPLFKFKQSYTFRDSIYDFLRKTAGNLLRLVRRPKAAATRTNRFLQIRSEDIFPPYGAHTPLTMLNKWLYFLLTLLDNGILFFRIMIRHREDVKSSDVIVGYENAFSFVSKLLARMYGKKYVNKFQGVVPLKASNENKRDCILYYPSSYFGLLPSDLCYMVNDGSNGEFYARMRGCTNIYFQPHGVAVGDYASGDAFFDMAPFESKFIVFNNASNSKLKRTDRAIRPLRHLSEAARKKIVLITTYHAEDLEELKEFTQSIGVSENVVFLDKLDHLQSNYLLRHSHVSIMTNDVSNLGNPVLESIYYGVPVITLDDNSTTGFIKDKVDGFLIPFTSSFDQEMAAVLEKLALDEDYYRQIKENLSHNTSVNTLETQQAKEFLAIAAVMGMPEPHLQAETKSV